MKTRRMALLLLVLALLGVLPVMSVSAQDSLIESVCLVTDLGRVNDGTFNQFAHEGAVLATDEFGLTYTFIETVAQTDYEKNIDTCLSEGYSAIVTVGFLLAETTAAKAAANPDVYFIGVDQFVAEGAPNYVGLQFREDQGGFLAGALAAQMSQTGTVAGVYGIDIPPVIKFRNGFEQGAKFVNPDITLLGTYIPSFTDPAAGGTAANQFIGEGADVVFGAGGPTGSGGIVEAAKGGAFVIGVDQDEFVTTFGNGEADGADKIISSAVKRVDQAVYLALKALVEGGAEFPGGSNLILSASNDGVGFAPAHDAAVPEEVTARMEEILAGLKDGSIVTGVDPVGGSLLPTLSEAATAAGTFTTLLTAVEAAGLTETVDTAPAITVFAPTDEAFAALPADTLAALLADPAALTNVLLYHVVGGAKVASDVVGATTLTTMLGSDVTVTVTDEGVFLNDTVQIVTTDILVRNGVIHVINAVLLPPE
ncbi:MAG: BMP family ABC transporter substrate-binding protein [Anaerolineae bacterium]|nr:BMP family ABC transporter substrate-binding protein [Anaerolineae bacterium]